MPYIKKDIRREKLRNGEPALLAGELNYQIFYFVKHNYYQQYILNINIRLSKGKFRNQIEKFVDLFLGEKPNYQKYNDVSGVMIRCYKEIKRRLGLDVKELFMDIMDSYDDEIAKYEDTKIESNGDVE